MLRNALLATMAGAPLVLLGCGDGLAGTGTGTDDGGGAADANFGPDGAAPTSDGATASGMDATSMDGASQGHDDGSAPNEGGSAPEAGRPDGSSGGSCGTCPGGQVCCEPPLGCAGMCVPDCRQGGSCPQGLTCDQSTGVCSPSGDGGMMPPPDGGMMPPPDGGMMPPPDGGMMPPPDGGMMPPPDGGMMPPPDGGMMPPPDGGMMPPPDGGMMPPPDGGMMPPPDGGSGSDGGGGGSSDAGDSSGAAPPGIGKITGTGGVNPPIAGDNVSIDDTTIVLGDSGPACYNGHAFFYVWDGVSSWQLQQEIVDPDAVAMGGGYNFDCFGGAVVVKGDVAFVSSPVWGSDQGEVYEYTRSGTTWTQASTILDSTLNGSVAHFGQSLAYDGTHLAAGAPSMISNGTGGYTGRVDVLTKGNVNWNVQKTLYAPVPASSACFGTSVAINGSRLAAGADGGPNGNYVKAGAAYSYTVSGSTWTYEAAAVGLDTVASDGFGESVALAAAGSQPALLVVGAPAASPLAAQSGAAYVFYLDTVSSQWVQNAKLVPSDGVASDAFGYTVGAVSSTQVIIGASGASKAYLFTFAGGQTWNQTTIYESCPTTIGWSMATWGTLAVTGKTDAVVLDTSLTNPGCGGN